VQLEVGEQRLLAEHRTVPPHQRLTGDHHPGRAHHDGEGTERPGSLDGLADRVVVVAVTGYGGGPFTELGNKRRGSIFVGVQEQDARSSSDEPAGRGTAEAAGAAGDDRRPSTGIHQAESDSRDSPPLAMSCL
jgi:hypothetical protein